MAKTAAICLALLPALALARALPAMPVRVRDTLSAGGAGAILLPRGLPRLFGWRGVGQPAGASTCSSLPLFRLLHLIRRGDTVVDRVAVFMIGLPGAGKVPQARPRAQTPFPHGDYHASHDLMCTVVCARVNVRP